jgi:hypothetical protein
MGTSVVTDLDTANQTSRYKQVRIMAAMFFVYCVIVFIAVIFAKSNSPTCNCNDTVVNWLIKEQFCNLHVWLMFIRAKRKSWG